MDGLAITGNITPAYEAEDMFSLSSWIVQRGMRRLAIRIFNASITNRDIRDRILLRLGSSIISKDRGIDNMIDDVRDVIRRGVLHIDSSNENDRKYRNIIVDIGSEYIRDAADKLIYNIENISLEE